MLAHRSILGFCCRWLAVFSVLIVPWPKVVDSYRHVYQGILNASFRIAWPEWRVRVAPLPSFDLNGDLLITGIGVRGQYMIGRKAEISSRLQGYLPTAFTVALLLATQFLARKKIQALIFALVAVHLYVIARAIVFVLFAFSGALPDSLFVISSVSEKLRDGGKWIVFGSMFGYFAVPLLIWVASLWFFGPRSEPLLGRTGRRFERILEPASRRGRGKTA